MDMTILGLIAVGTFGIFYVVFTWGNTKGSKNKGKTTAATNDKNKVAVNKEKSLKNDDKKKTEEIQRKDMFKFIEFEKIVDDMILQEKENKYTMVVQCKGINYDLMSEVEQIAVEEGFITFLNTLKSPIQLYVQARAIDLRTSLDIYKERVNDINQKYAEAVDRLRVVTNDIHASDAEVHEATMQKEKYGNMAEYAQDITRYVEKISLNKHMLQRKFYIVLSYYKSEINTTTEFTKTEIHDICYRELFTRAQSIISGLQSCSVSARVLNSNELAELLYISYNRDDEKLIDIKTALDSGFYRMYSTTKDIQDKKREALEKQIQADAMNRVELALKAAIAGGMIKSNDEVIEEYENEVDLTAIKILQDTNINEEDKKEAQEIILESHNQGVDRRQKEREERQKNNSPVQAEEKTNDNNVEVKEEPVNNIEVQKEKTDSNLSNEVIKSSSDDSIV